MQLFKSTGTCVPPPPPSSPPLPLSSGGKNLTVLQSQTIKKEHYFIIYKVTFFSVSQAHVLMLKLLVRFDQQVLNHNHIVYHHTLISLQRNKGK